MKSSRQGLIKEMVLLDIDIHWQSIGQNPGRK
ncbi:hypothetical protein DFA_01965 [Cavenderia fasciculata]|uniref:Uncharacterized protein n=1 Tax=Cavenderia fasciculata TaxID=261658 RepID=F4PR18_CACFS|nr:uncharacterized protein DFA_01965 [Cavenderia fasciculata]EGG22075.1 hypothetical protein DFA_01965 [Cavenderia fasciculata]|eukprot:XP_004359926.1 hypothetical protein DFA_01965 [Cavenderia fasciculata]